MGLLLSNANGVLVYRFYSKDHSLNEITLHANSHISPTQNPQVFLLYYASLLRSCLLRKPPRREPGWVNYYWNLDSAGAGEIDSRQGTVKDNSEAIVCIISMYFRSWIFVVRHRSG